MGSRHALDRSTVLGRFLTKDLDTLSDRDDLLGGRSLLLGLACRGRVTRRGGIT